MLTQDTDQCIICKYDDIGLRKICSVCINTYAHAECLENMISNNINTCPTCRKEICTDLECIYIKVIHSEPIDNLIIYDTNIESIDQSIKKKLIWIYNIIIWSIFSFVIYILCCFCGFIIGKILVYETTIDLFSFKFFIQAVITFGLNCIIIHCCKNN